MQIIPRSKLDVIKYSNCLQTAENYRIYAEYWYLDCLTNQRWDCLVYNDYQAIMPIPYKKYFGIKVVTQPIFVQQLGVFSKEKISEELFQSFFKELNKYLIRSYSFNEENTQNHTFKGVNKNNFILDLNQSYKDLFLNYRKDRKNDLKLIKKLDLKLENSSDEDSIYNLFNSNYYELSQIINQNYFKKIISCCGKNNSLQQINVFMNNELIASGLILISKTRIINLFQVRKKGIKKNGSTTFIINYFIENYANQNMILDFEGSNLEGIADFFKSFGSELKQYKSIGFSVK